MTATAAATTATATAATAAAAATTATAAAAAAAAVVNFMYFLLPEGFFYFIKRKLMLFRFFGVILYFCWRHLECLEPNRRFALTLDSDVRDGVIGHS